MVRRILARCTGSMGKEIPDILIVEDEGIVALSIKTTLLKMGYHVCGVAPTGRKALEIIKKKSTDLVLMDIQLRGDMDGIETAGLIKKEYDIPVIYVTAHSDEGTMARAEKTHPSAFLSKPLADGLLKQTIEEIICHQSI